MRYLVKIRYALSGLIVVDLTTNNLYEWVGRLCLSSLERIERIDYSIYTEDRYNFWKENTSIFKEERIYDYSELR